MLRDSMVKLRKLRFFSKEKLAVMRTESFRYSPQSSSSSTT
uniref:Uncharacterized protein n=1 Tax=Onchocerca volvulus TaxID=6282 RepID=A0A8R1TQI2_ONCVO